MKRVFGFAWLLCVALVMGDVQNLRGTPPAEDGKTTEAAAEKPESTQDVGAVVQEAKETVSPAPEEAEVGTVAKEPAEPVKGEPASVPETPETAPASATAAETHAKPGAKGEGKPLPEDVPPEIEYDPADGWEGDDEYPYNPYDPEDTYGPFDDPLAEYGYDPDVDGDIEESEGADGKDTDDKSTEGKVAVAAGTAAAAAAGTATGAHAEKLRWGGRGIRRWGRRPIRRWGRRPIRRWGRRPIHHWGRRPSRPRPWQRPWYRPRPYRRPRPYYRPRYCLKWAWGRCVWWGR